MTLRKVMQFVTAYGELNFLTLRMLYGDSIRNRELRPAPRLQLYFQIE